jgi:hypothetical protein
VSDYQQHDTIGKSAYLKTEEWEALDRLAAHLGVMTIRGPGAPRPSWRALLWRMSKYIIPSASHDSKM